MNTFGPLTCSSAIVGNTHGRSRRRLADGTDHIVRDAGRGERRRGFRHAVTLDHRQADAVEEMRERHIQRSATARHITDARAQRATHGVVYGRLIRQVFGGLLHGRLLAGLLHARPVASGLGGLEEQAALPAHAGLAEAALYTFSTRAARPAGTSARTTHIRQRVLVSGR